MKRNKMRIIGITGGIGSGKSTVLKELAKDPEAEVLEADPLAKELYLPGEKAYLPLIRAFGEDILDEDGLIDRRKLSGIVFQDPEKLQLLNSILHPLIRQEISDRIQKAEKAGKKTFYLEAALLLQDGYRDICHEIWLIHADREVRIKRLMEGRGMDRDRAEAVMNSQPDEEWYRERCDKEIDNNAPLAVDHKM